MLNKNFLKSEKGFTLLEVLVTVTVLSIVTLSLATLLDITLRIWKKGQGKAEIYQELRAVLDMVSLDIKCVVPAYNGNKPNDIFLFQCEKNQMYKASAKTGSTFADRLDVVTTSGKGSSQKEGYNIIEVNFFLGDATALSTKWENPRKIEIDLGNEHHLFLARGPAPNLLTSGEPPNAPQAWTSSDFPGRPLGNNITSVKYSFCDTNLVWVDNWGASKKYLPKAVKMAITATDDNGIYGNPTVEGSGDSLTVTIRLFQENCPNNWW